MKELIIAFIFTISTAIAQDDFIPRKPSVIPSRPAKNTMIFWVNGDADRFRNEEGSGSKIVRLDVLDVDRIKQLSQKCNCNIVLFHDQRGTNRWFNRSKHFSTFLYSYSKGKPVKFGNKNYLQFNEVDQSKRSFLATLLKFSQDLFPGTSYHLIYRGHSFATDLTHPESVSFDRSSSGSYHIKDFIASIKESKVRLSTVTFAACSMAYVEMALALTPFANYMIASQINIHETGITGFSFEYLTKLNDQMSEEAIAHVLAKTMLERFRTVKEKELFLRETPAVMIDLNKISVLKDDISFARIYAVEAVKNSREDFAPELITAKTSERYMNLRKSEGISDIVLNVLKDKMQSADDNTTSYDFIEVLQKLGWDDLAENLKGSVVLYDYSDFTHKSGISFDIGFN